MVVAIVGPTYRKPPVGKIARPVVFVGVDEHQRLAVEAEIAGPFRPGGPIEIGRLLLARAAAAAHLGAPANADRNPLRRRLGIHEIEPRADVVVDPAAVRAGEVRIVHDQKIDAHIAELSVIRCDDGRVARGVSAQRRKAVAVTPVLEAVVGGPPGGVPEAKAWTNVPDGSRLTRHGGNEQQYAGKEIGFHCDATEAVRPIQGGTGGPTAQRDMTAATANGERLLAEEDVEVESSVGL